MNIGIINPYFDSLSGGERYTLTLAGHWSKKHAVSVFWDDPTVIRNASERLHIDLSRVKVVSNIFRRRNILSKLIKTRSYDVLFFLSDGSIPMVAAKHNILHFQVPFQSVALPMWKRRMYDAVVVNSIFTKTNLDPVVGGNAEVIYPPVETEVRSGKKKEKIILTVGRFTGRFEMKKQDFLIDTFKKITSGLRDWKLVCIGGLLPNDEAYFARLRKKAEACDIALLPNCSHTVLVNYYQKASIYWHAAGFGETDPALQEHFGISTVEAMAYGCIPVVYNGGGQREIIDDGINGHLWNTPLELIDKTTRITASDFHDEALRKRIIEKSKQFDVAIFVKKFDDLLSRITS